eukprot:CAMPEP_0194395986 /NCGR_PEP_ID=MMETSP0174-20130528/124727_1 /TAXON_ID=216777 /ORGANISM="Proboscia alata, Strain PI-D3" /LENGTH=487 /DNA_ID=CAMNT_0039191981 /DNA_START=35 /DNA_END=1496 /DNA_ORIENTATION=-
MVEQPSPGGYGGYAYSGAPGWNDNNNKPTQHNHNNTNDHSPAWNNRGQGNLNHYQPQQQQASSVKQEEENVSMPAQTGPPPLAPPNPGLPPPPISTNPPPQTQASTHTPAPTQTPTQLPANIDAAKIFVGGLSWQTTEESLRYHFEQFGEVVSVEIMRDRNTNNPRGFAFVVFSEDATVELVMRDPEAPQNGNGRFSNRVHEINHKVVDVKRAQARGLAPPSIHYGDAPPDGVPIKAEGGGPNVGPPPPFAPNPYMNAKHQQPPPSNNPQQQQQHAANNQNQTPSPESLQNKIFVGGLHQDHKVVDVKRAQARGLAPPSIHYGDAPPDGVPIKAEGGGPNVAPPPPFAPNPYMNAKHQQPPPSNNPSQQQQQHANSGNNNQTPSPESLQNKIFVGGLHLGVDREALKTYFSQFGCVVDAIVMVDPIHRRSRGFGFVTFEDGSMGAQRAMAHNTPHKLLDKFVEIKLATPKGGDPGVGGGGGAGGFKK